MLRAEGMIGLSTAFLMGKRQPESALEPLMNAVQLLKKIEDPGDRETGSLAGALDRLGSALADTGNRDGALASYLEAQKTLRRLPADKPENAASLATNLLNIAKLKDEMGERKEAESDLSEAEKIGQPFLDSSGTPNEEIAFLFANLGRAYNNFKNNSRSVVCYQTALKQLQRLTEIDHRFSGPCARILNDYADVLKSDKRVGDLVRIYRESSDFLRKLNSPEEAVEADLAVTLGNLGYCLLEAGSTEEAVAAYEEADRLLTRLSSVSDRYAPSHLEIKQGLMRAYSLKLKEEFKSCGSLWGRLRWLRNRLGG